MNILPLWLTFGHCIHDTAENFLIIIIVYVSFVLQIMAAYYAIRIRVKTYKVRHWSIAWGVFIVAMLVVLIKRVFEVHANFDLLHLCNGHFGLHFLIESLWMIFLSVCWLFFIYKIKKFLDEYYR